MTRPPQPDPARQKRLEESFIKHAALARLYRWCQNGEPNAHAIKSYVLDVTPGGAIGLTAELDRYAAGSPAADMVRTTPVRCRAEMTPLDGTLPHFARMEIVQETGSDTVAHDDPYVRNRLLSLVHYFTSLVENPARDPAPFREILSEGFALHYVAPPISNHAMLDEWVTGRLASVVASNHTIQDFAFETAGSGEYVITVDMESEALFPDGSGIISKNKQTWRVVDDVSERFARISKVRIDRDSVHRFNVPDAAPKTPAPHSVEQGSPQ